MSTIKPILRGVLNGLLKHLEEDELLHFNKIHCAVEDMNKSRLINAIQLVERTLRHNGVDYVSVVQNCINNITIDK